MWYNFYFSEPRWLWLLLVPTALVIWYIFRKTITQPVFRFSSLKSFEATRGGLRKNAPHLLFGLRILFMVLAVLIIARPQTSSSSSKVVTEGIDIVMALDISGSMLALDFKPNRLEAAKNVAADFINSRPYDRIGLVVFSGESFTQCPLTSDHPVLLNLFNSIQSGMIEDGTAIGSGLATAVNRLRESKAISKVIILLTDGVNNQGSVAPITAAEIAKKYGIRVYTVGVGTRGMAPYPVQTPIGIQYQNMQVEIDESVLNNIADLTGGHYFRATDNDKLKEVYTEIDQMEKNRVELIEHARRHDEYFMIGLLAGFLLLAEFVLRHSWLRSIP